jgi:hypothetical protein
MMRADRYRKAGVGDHPESSAPGGANSTPMAATRTGHKGIYQWIDRETKEGEQSTAPCGDPGRRASTAHRRTAGFPTEWTSTGAPPRSRNAPESATRKGILSSARGIAVESSPSSSVPQAF